MLFSHRDMYGPVNMLNRDRVQSCKYFKSLIETMYGPVNIC